MTNIANSRQMSIGRLNEHLATLEMEISDGYGIYKSRAFRIAHMGEVTAADLDRLFNAIDAFLTRNI